MSARLSPLATRLLLLTWGLGVLAGCEPEALPTNPCSGVTCTASHCEVQNDKPVCVRGPNDSPYPNTVRIKGPTETAAESTLAMDPNNETRAKGYFSFDAEPRHVYRFGCSAQSRICLIRLLNEHGRELKATTLPVELGSVQGGRFYLEVSVQRFGADVVGILWGFQDLGIDDYFDSEATRFDPAAGPLTGEFEREQDTEPFLVQLRGGRPYRSTCTRTNVGLCRVAVSGPSSSTLVASHQGSEPGYFTVPADGEYLLALNTGTGTQQGPWSYRLEEVVDDHGNSDAAATWLTLPVPPIVGRIEPPADVDVFAFSAANVGHVYRIVCEAAVNQSPWALTLMHGTQPMGGEPFRWGTSATLAVELSTPGTYTASVSGGSDRTRTGGYTCRVEDAGPDDHGDDAAHATPLTLGTDTAGYLETWGDKDVFSVLLTAGSTYTLRVSDGVEVLMSKPDGSEFWRSGFTYTFTATTSGLHTLQASLVSHTTLYRKLGPYQLQLQTK